MFDKVWPGSIECFYEDPIKGDPDVVVKLATTYSDTAVAIQAVANSVKPDGWVAQSHAQSIAALREDVVALAESVTKAESRYSGVAAAISPYAEVLHREQETSLLARAAAIPAKEAYQARQGDVGYWESEVRRFQRYVYAWSDLVDQSPFDPELRSDYNYWQGELRGAKAELKTAQGERDAAHASLGEALKQLHGAIANRDDAADRAKYLLDEVSQNSEIRDTWRDKLGEIVSWVKSALAAIHEALDSITEFLGGEWVVMLLKVALAAAAAAMMTTVFLAPVGVGIMAALSALNTVDTILQVLDCLTLIVDGIASGSWEKFGMGVAALAMCWVGAKLGKALKTVFAGDIPFDELPDTNPGAWLTGDAVVDGVFGIATAPIEEVVVAAAMDMSVQWTTGAAIDCILTEYEKDE
jgi:hypothetical protein